MTLREQAAQLLFPRIGSNMVPPVTVAEDVDRVAAMLERCPVGGLVLFNGDWATTPRHLERLQALCDVPLLIGSDIERGAGQQVKGATVFPHARAFGALGGEVADHLEAAARVTAREARACGLHIAFAPVADVNVDPRNPIIATRAFGEAPEPVAALIRAYIRGCRAEGLLTTAKHFPGHGNTHQDSHAELPVVQSDRAALEAVELAPFRAAIEAGADLMMTAHVAYPALDPSGEPATASRPILHDLLRETMQFQGAVITDSLLMAGIRQRYDDAGSMAVALLNAGVDMLLDHPDPEQAVVAIEQAVDAGHLAEARVHDAWARVRHLRRCIMPDQHAAVDPEAHRNLARWVASHAVTVVGGDGGIVPLNPLQVSREGMLVILLKPYRTHLDPPEEPLGRAVQRAIPGVKYVELGPEATPEQHDQVMAMARHVPYVLVTMIVKPAAWRSFGLLDHQMRLVQTLVAGQSVILASLGSPQPLHAFPEATLRLCTYSDVPVAQEALVEVLLGAAS